MGPTKLYEAATGLALRSAELEGDVTRKARKLCKHETMTPCDGC